MSTPVKLGNKARIKQSPNVVHEKTTYCSSKHINHHGDFSNTLNSLATIENILKRKQAFTKTPSIKLPMSVLM